MKTAQARFCCVVLGLCVFAELAGVGGELWETARTQARYHRYSTLFTAQDVRDRLSTEDGLKQATEWCREMAVTKVYVETFRDGYQAEKQALQKARDTFRAAGFQVSGCVTPTKVGKPSTRWKEAISCYTDLPTQEKVGAIFEYAAGLFDEIMIDDFWFTDCACPECEGARQARLVKIGEKQFPVSGDTWDDYRCELMVQLSCERVLAPAKRVNRNARLIIKYPQWYDRFHERGYEVVRETVDFGRTWVGTETRDYEDKRWGGTPQYEAYFIMRWLGGLGGAKCGGGWFDPFGTTEATYVEQARQTVLGGAAESMLFCYGALQRDTGPRNTAALRTQIPELLQVAKQVRKRKIIGVAAYKPANSPPGNEPRVFDFVGMLGIPLVPCHEFPSKAPAAFFSMHALKDPALVSRLSDFIKRHKPVLLTDGLATVLSNKVDLAASNVRVLAVKQDPKSLLQLSQSKVDAIRALLLKPLKISLEGPAKLGCYLFSDGSWVLENFLNEPVTMKFKGEPVAIQARQWQYTWK